MRAGVLVAVATIVVGASPARAEPRLEASGFIGLGYFPEDTQLGNSWAPEQVPNTAPVLGARIGWVALPSLVELGSLHVELAVEGELSLATAFTGGTPFVGDTGRMSYFAPVFGWRTHASFRLAGWSTLRPNLVVGVGGETVASSSPFMSKETDPVVYWGPGVGIPISSDWVVRVDVRHGIMAARGDGVTSIVEMQLGLSTTFGPPVKRVRPPPEPEPVAALDDTDTDGDGIPDRLDLCPFEKESVNGVDDGDGCPEADPDGDGIIGAADKCPDAAEDFDHFEDEDGCPELDNDQDGIDDARDVCPLVPETHNGFEDDDGCPDTIPDDITKALATAATLKFEPARARITDKAKDPLQKLLAVLVARPDLKITIAGRPEKAGDDDLAKRRAEAVKWYLVDQGIIEDRIDTKVGATGKPALELTLTPH